MTIIRPGKEALKPPTRNFHFWNWKLQQKGGGGAPPYAGPLPTYHFTASNVDDYDTPTKIICPISGVEATLTEVPVSETGGPDDGPRMQFGYMASIQRNLSIGQNIPIKAITFWGQRYSNTLRYNRFLTGAGSNKNFEIDTAGNPYFKNTTNRTYSDLKDYGQSGWWHMALSYDPENPTQMMAWYNGTKSALQHYPGWTNNELKLIGCDVTINYRYVGGMADIRIYSDDYLTTDDVTAIIADRQL